ncbi:MAG: hypothetical protein ACMUJM_14215 [bacterium]
MFSGKKPLTLLFIIITACALILPLSANAQYWSAMPPYNILWPLWSPALSPPDPVSGVATPLVTSVTKNTILPSQPALVYDPVQPLGYSEFPFLLYNTPAALGGGLLYWDQYVGMNPWPPSYMLDSVTAAPAPIALPLGWSLIAPWSLSTYPGLVSLGNLIYSYQYGVPLSNLLTAAEIWGLPPLTSLTSPII